MNRTSVIIVGAVILLGAVVFIGSRSGNFLSTGQSGVGNQQTSASGKVDGAKFGQYIKDFYLGKLPEGVTALLPAGMVEPAAVFAPGESICVVTEFSADVPKGAYAEAIYDLGAQKMVGEKAVNNGLNLNGSTRKCTQYGLPVGTYEFDVYLDDVLAGVFPFEIKE